MCICNVVCRMGLVRKRDNKWDAKYLLNFQHEHEHI